MPINVLIPMRRMQGERSSEDMCHPEENPKRAFMDSNQIQTIKAWTGMFID